MALIFAALAAYFGALVFTPLVRRLAARFGVVDRPDRLRKFHATPTPALGGIAVAAAIATGILLAIALGALPGLHIKGKFLIGIAIAAVLLLIGGALDDRYRLKPWQQILWPVLASLATIASGIGTNVITNPFGGAIRLDSQVFTVLWWQDVPYKITLLADLFTFAWLMGMTYTTKLLDGLDGLVSGVTAIGCLVIAAVSLTRDAIQPDTIALALIVAAAFFGFLRFNFSPATIFLGEGGSTLAGFLLGVLAIISGGKIATTFLVLGLPLCDAVLVIARRLLRRQSPFKGGRDHLHHRLADSGLSHRAVVLWYYLAAATFGSLTLVLRDWPKIIAIALAFAAVPLASWYAARRKKPPASIPVM